MSPIRCAVITLVRARHEHLLLQRAGVVRSTRPPEDYVVVAMGDEQVRPLLAERAPGAEVLELPLSAEKLPLADARNLGAEHALSLGAELLIFLDVDCVPAPRLIERYAQAATLTGPALLCGPVGYLPAPAPGGYRLALLAAQARPHPARPLPGEHELLAEDDLSLFWSLSFAIGAADWRRVGGFCEKYRGYGGEDTDFAQMAAAAGLRMLWVGGAWAYHQHHTDEQPPLRHAGEIVENANLFHRRWGWWPMEGWLELLADCGLARFERASGRWETIET
jgi:GT2 family glycosyltransferase